MRVVESEVTVQTLTQLAEPLSEQHPCGASLDETQTLVAIEAFRVFGRLTPAENEPDWHALRELCGTALKDSKDLRVLAHYTAAAVRLDSLAHVLRIFPLVETWLGRFWDTLHPRIDDDAIVRRNALTLFADPVGIADALRRMPFVSDQRFGSFCVRDLDIASGVLVPKEPGAAKVSTDLIHAALTAADPQTLRTLAGCLTAAASALQGIETTMLTRGGGSAMVPELTAVTRTLERVREMLAPHVIDPPASAPVETGSAAVPAANSADVGSVASRQDVLRALDAVMRYYARSEPSSVVPVVVERAKRLVSMGFLDALAELTPDVVSPVKQALGLREATSVNEN
jgi:type VI secretion system protein ImpA